MPSRTSDIRLLRQRVVESSQRGSSRLMGGELTGSGMLDRTVLNRQIDEILDGVAEMRDLATQIQHTLDAFVHALQQDDVPASAKHVCALLSLELDDLRKAALLSLMVRLAGKRKFDPIASYIFQNRKVFVTRRG